MLHALCDGCNPQKQQTVTVWLQDEVIFEQQLPALPEQTIRIPFTLNDETAIMRARVEMCIRDRCRNVNESLFITL